MRLWHIIVPTVLSLLLSACGGSKAPDLLVTSVTNTTPPLSLAHAEKPILMTFWATTCPSCLEEIPGLSAMQAEFGDKIAVVGVAMSYDDPKQLQAFIQQKKIPYMIAHDVDQSVSKGFGGIYVTPTNLLISPQGEVEWKQVGTPDFAVVKQRIQAMLGK